MITIADKQAFADFLYEAIEDISQLKGWNVSGVDDHFASYFGYEGRTITNWRTTAKQKFKRREFYALLWLVIFEGKKDLAWVEGFLQATNESHFSVPITEKWLHNEIWGAKQHYAVLPGTKETITEVIHEMFAERRAIAAAEAEHQTSSESTELQIPPADSELEALSEGNHQSTSYVEPNSLPIKLPQLQVRQVFLMVVLALFLSASVYMVSAQRSNQPEIDDDTSTSMVAAASTPISSNSDWEPDEIVIRHNGSQTTTNMVLVPAGSFFMGATPEEIDALFEWCTEIKKANYTGFTCPRQILFETLGPTSEQNVNSFLLDKYEVTRSDYNSCVAAGYCTAAYDPPGLHANEPASTRADQPINNVTLFQAYRYCEWRGARLPTEVEWEYAARGPDRVRFPWETEVLIINNTDTDRVNHCDVNCGNAPWSVDSNTRTGRWRHITQYDDGYTGTAPVKSYPEGASWVGALNMAGNVQEWTTSLYRPLPYDNNVSENDSTLRTADLYTIKGGSYGNSIYVSVTFWRSGFGAGDYSPSIGIRCAMTPE